MLDILGGTKKKGVLNYASLLEGDKISLVNDKKNEKMSLYTLVVYVKTSGTFFCVVRKFIMRVTVSSFNDDKLLMSLILMWAGDLGKDFRGNLIQF